ncbi:MAG: hypothetical protein N3C12_06365 [Candidatus Binatia bacterium]|nr:hypothetical protein [Candidatus Binatia bacterium]
MMLTRLLRQRGYRTVGSDVVGPVWRRYASQVGGLFDPITGDAYEAKWRTACGYVSRDLAHSHGIDVLAVSFISERPFYVQYEGFRIPNVAYEPLTWFGRPVEDLPQLIFVLRLNLLLMEPDGRVLYEISVPTQWRTVYVARSYYRRPDDELLSTGVVQRAVGWLVEDLQPVFAPEVAPTLQH